MGGTGSSAYAGGYFYGNVKTPRHFGSNSKSDDKVAYGGGIISVVATTSAEVNGMIRYINFILLFRKLIWFFWDKM